MKATEASLQALAGFLVVGLAAAAAASSPPPLALWESDVCMKEVLGKMMSCMDHMGIGAKENQPDEACCDGAKVVALDHPWCFCVFVAAAPTYDISLNLTRAASLPGVCRISNAPPLKECLGNETVIAAGAESPLLLDPDNAPAPAPAPGSASLGSVPYILMPACALFALLL